MSRAALAVVSLLLLAGCGSSDSAPVTADRASVRAALEARLLAKNLSFRWVVCVRTKRSFAGEVVFRCNVNFGEPHIVRYCATLDGGQLVTSHEQPAIRCGRSASS